MALAELKVPAHRTAMVSGIGCSGKTPHYIKAYGFHTLHGRSLPYATGIKLANPDLEVVVMGGDGDGLGIGAGHFVRAGRYELDARGYDGVVRDDAEVPQKLAQAVVKALEWGDEIPIGVLYQNERVSTFEERIAERVPSYRANPPSSQVFWDDEKNASTDLSKLLKDLTFP